MNLSNRLTFSLVFSVLLVAAFIFVVPQAMAQVEVTYIATLRAAVDADATATPAVAAKDGSWVVTFTFTDGGSFNKNNFITGPADAKVINVSLNEDAVVEDAFSYGDNKLTVPIPHAGNNSPALAFTVTGYDAETSIAESTASDADPIPSLTPISDALLGKAYRVYARVVTGDGAPQLPSGFTPTEFLPATVGLPADFESFFSVGGGTIDLKVTGTAKNSKHIIINEIMWASDDRLIGQDGQFNQQWIEIYNNSSIPVADTTISFTFINNESGLNPPAEIADGTSDRLSNINSRTNVWTLKGSSSGTSTTDDADTEPKIIGASPAFSSMYRNKQGDNGWAAGSWAASPRAYFPGFLGSPGAVNKRAGLPTTVTKPGAVSPAFSSIIINEIGITDTGQHWIELYNKGDAKQALKNWRLSIATGFDAETAWHIFPEKFHDDDDDDKDVLAEIPSKGYLLLVNADPEGTPLSRGYDVSKAHDDQAYGVVNEDTDAINQGYHKYYIVPGNKIAIPDDKNWLLILRDNHEDKFRNTSHKLQDVAGPGQFVKNDQLEEASPAKDKKPNGDGGGAIWHTTVWPMNGRGDEAKNLLGVNDLATSDVVLRRENIYGFLKGAFKKAAVTGIGYDRRVTGDKYAGTPGHPNDAVQNQIGTLSEEGAGIVYISELMLTQGKRGRDPQWIELHNSSRTQAVNLAADGGWILTIENHDSGQWEGERNLVVDINLESLGTIPPNQTVLIASTEARQVSTNGNIKLIPEHRVLVISNDNDLEDEFFMDSRFDPFLNTNGFYLKLSEGKVDDVTKERAVADEVGNLDGNNRTYDDAHEGWSWPTDLTEDDERTSLIRLRNDDGTPRVAIPDLSNAEDTTGAVVPIGTPSNRRGTGKIGEMDEMKTWRMYPDFTDAAWVHADDTGFEYASNTYYGDSNDIGTPLHTAGTPLPVSLSFFRPSLEDGKVVIRWTTESELDNAGFNILRSQDRNGEFTKVNEQLIQGKGTTAERSTYKWVDTSAKPGAVYYYQIEDVSFAGERNTLTTTKMKGLISAANKLTTKWGELKEVQ